MRSYYVVPLSPEILENMGNDISVLEFLESLECSTTDTGELDCRLKRLERKWKKYLSIRDRLPDREIDMLEMSFLMKKDQMSIGKIFNVSQGDVSYRIRRVAQRAKFLMSLPKLDFGKLKEDLLCVINPERIEILFLLLDSTSQSKVGCKVGLSQGKVRHRYIKSLEVIKEKSFEDPNFFIYYDLFIKLQGNFNALRSLDVQDRWKHKFQKEDDEF